METQCIEINAQTPATTGYLITLDKSSVSVPAIEIGEFFTVGRDSCNKLVLSDPFVSGRHARIERRANGFTLRDQNSRNGTYLNGSRITEAILSAGDRIRFGETVLAFSETPNTSSRIRSRNTAWDRQLERLPAFAATDFPVLITGPSGSGKEILAQAVHDFSSRRSGRFISINCSALSETLIESELFGHTKGSFTGATHDRKGAFETARGGTLFLDEIGDLPLALQPKLLRALENREIRPVGSDKTIDTNVRIIAATHKNLIEQVARGVFREDLFYRLNVCHISPPALADRMEDFEDLLYRFSKQMKVRFSFNSIQRLKEYNWPGNVRELKNTVARASAYMPGEYIQPEHIDQLLEHSLLLKPPEKSWLGDAELTMASGHGGSLIKEIEREMIVRSLIANQGNQRRAAADLGLPKSTLHDRIRTYQIDIEAILKSFRKR